MAFGMGRYVLDENGEPREESDLLAWGLWMEHAPDRTVKQEEPVPGVKVSTVFLGLDHRFTNSGAPVLWETMIFGGGHDGYQDRYTSRDDAEAGHRKAVALAIEAARRADVFLPARESERDA